jgi:hypothetical protein
MSKSPKIHFILAALMILSGLSALLFPYLFTPPQALDWNFKAQEKLAKKAKSPEPFKFAVFGDNKNSFFTFSRLVSKVNKEDIDFSVETGDLIDNIIDGGAEYKLYLRQIGKLLRPLLVIPGNHETEGLSSAYYYLFGRNYYAFPYKNSYFIMLDGSHETGLGPEQRQWLQGELQKSISYARRFVFMHIPLYDPQEGDYAVGHSLTNTRASAELNDLFDKFKVTMVFTAHKHGLFQGKWHKTPFTITGGAGAELGGTDSKHYFNHYVVVEVGQNGVSYTVKTVRPPASNILSLFAHNVLEFTTFYLLAHWDLFLLAAGSIYLFAVLISRGVTDEI